MLAATEQPMPAALAAGAGRDYDIVVVGDFRFPGGTSTAIAEELTLQARLGYRTGLIHRRASVLRAERPFHPLIQAALERGDAEMVEGSAIALTGAPLKVGLLQLHHPFVFTRPITPLPAIDAEQAILVVHQPPFSADGRPYYDVPAVQAVLDEAIGQRVAWAPISPQVRAQFVARQLPVALLAEDWVNVIDPAAYRVGRRVEFKPRLVIGRHARPDWQKWPDDRARVLLTLPRGREFDVRILGGGEFLQELCGQIPANWAVLGFDEMEVRRFLAELDVYVYYHHSTWVEGFGRNVLEAMASGLPVIMAPAYRPLFGDGVLYAEPAAVAGLLAELQQAPVRRRIQGGRAVEVVRERFGPDQHQARLAGLIGAPAKRLRHAVRAGVPAREHVLFMSSNGVGVGHLTRLLAIARRLPAELTPVFATMSQARAVVEPFGYSAEYLPFHAYLESDPELWNRHLLAELDVMLDFYRPRVLVFDGNTPYAGLIGLRRRWPECRFVWIRRSMWPRGADPQLLRRADSFDCVIEPGELAGSIDRGPTIDQRAGTRQVPPIMLLDPSEMLPRAAARQALGLRPDSLAVLVQLGSGNNSDTWPVLEQILALIGSRPDVEVVFIEWLIAEMPQHLQQGCRRLQAYPVARYLAAFDRAISAAGYNSFHELAAVRLPTLFVPNADPSMDFQTGRARFLRDRGAGLVAEAGQLDQLPRLLQELLEPATGAAIARNLAACRIENGAAAAAALVAELADG